MSYFLIGVAAGAGLALFAVGAAGLIAYLAFRRDSRLTGVEKEAHDEVIKRRRRLQLQYENLMRYDGTVKHQQALDD